MAFPIDLSVTGKPSPRTHERIGSASNKKPFNQNKDRNQTSNIFWNENTQKKKTQVHGVISKTQLESVRNLTTPANKGGERASYPSPRKLAPDGVPKLKLDVFEDKDEDLTYSKVAPKQINTSLTSKDTVSWGTAHQKKQARGGGWQVSQSRQPTRGITSSSRNKHDDVPQLNLQLSNTNEGLDQLRQAAKKVREENNVEYFSNQKERNKKINQATNEPGKQQSIGCREKQQIKKTAFIEDTFLMDQMLNTKITDEKPPAQNCYALANEQRFNSKQKRHDDMHSKSAASVADINDNLSRRLPFAARIISLDGRNARRDINGFYFTDECSLTMYEYKQFGTKSKALPLIKRGVYKHLFGVRRGRPYSLLDINVGRDIIFKSSDHSILPESLKHKTFIMFRITSVNEEERENLLQYTCNCNKAERIPTIIKMKSQHKKEDEDDAKIHSTVYQLQKRLQKQIKSHGCRFFTNLHKHFNKVDRNSTGVIEKTEYKTALKSFRINLSDEEFDCIFSYVDLCNDNMFDYGDFIRVCFGITNEERKYWIRKAFRRLDPSKNGIGNITDVQKFYCVANDPDVLSGKMNVTETLERITECFQENPKKKEVSYTMFEAYYEGLSLVYMNDEDFIEVMKTTWTI